ncbi:N,N-dimethylformamidase beta subunit family domain-containing protein [Dactylosporangium sp. NPDC048998]|uniref:N,N-dimethylformamidase beta subunit family domain-containing protein n=1 Tax=Dactylosporangium sp. NPDC048998 TaxID=3363976 RepID=UPI0037168546
MGNGLPTNFPDFGLTAEERRFAWLNHFYEWPGMDGSRGEIWCYTDRMSYGPGELVRLQVSSTAPRFSLEIFRDGAVEIKVFEKSDLVAGWQDTPDQCSVEGCGWETTFEFEVGEGWPSGGYRLKLTAQGRDDRPIHYQHLLIVRPKLGQRKAGRVLQVAATSTWLAYNTWGGSNHYDGITGPGRNEWSPRVSTQRPWARGFVTLPPEAPRVPLEVMVPPKTAPRHVHKEWAYATGHSKKYASAGWATYDRHFLRFAERVGYDVDLISQHDLHFSPEILSEYDCVTIVGHDEYWTWEMRDAVDAYVEQGGGVARFAGNFAWQIRLEDEGRLQVCYKDRARALDPLYNAGRITRTATFWEAPEVGRPGARTFGLNATDGPYAGWQGNVPRGARGFPIYRPEHWAFADTGLFYGDVLGAESHIFGYEVDGLDYEIRGGLPYPSPSSGAPDGLEILAVGMASWAEWSNGLSREDFEFGDEEVRAAAELLFGEVTDDHIEKMKRGSGMIVNFIRGEGEVFNAGSCEWVAGLLRQDPMVERVTCNVLNRYLGRA